MKKFMAMAIAIMAMALPVSAAETPVFSLAWSEYPSWSAFGVAHMLGYIDLQEGRMGPIEEKWGVDIALEEAEYDPCLQMYGSGAVDAVCITNMDVLPPSIGRDSVMILPTSTSNGADALIVDKTIGEVDDLKGVPVYGLDLSVSRYMFERNLEILGRNSADFVFENMDPGAAAVAMQQKQKGYPAIVVWNPFVLETLNRRSDTRVLFDSTTIPGEIVDAVVVSRASLEKPGGQNFACAVIDAFYSVCNRMNAPETRDDTLIAIGEKFSSLDLASMRTVVKQTAFYDTPEKGLALMKSDDFKATMDRVVDFCLNYDLVDERPSVGYGSATGSNLAIDPSYIQTYLDKSTE